MLGKYADLDSKLDASLQAYEGVPNLLDESDSSPEKPSLPNKLQTESNARSKPSRRVHFTDDQNLAAEVSPCKLGSGSIWEQQSFLLLYGMSEISWVVVAKLNIEHHRHSGYTEAMKSKLSVQRPPLAQLPTGSVPRQDGSRGTAKLTQTSVDANRPVSFWSEENEAVRNL